MTVNEIGWYDEREDKILFVNGAPVGNPPAGHIWLYADAAGTLYTRTSAGVDTAVGTGAGHDAVTLDADAAVLLDLSTQEIGLDTQTANRVFAGPTTGAANEPTFRSLVAADVGSGTPDGTKFLRDDLSWQTPAGGDPDHAYYTQLAALLEPDAIEVYQNDTFSYAIASDETKYLLLGWWLNVGGAGRIEVRDPRNPLPLRGVTVVGTNVLSVAAFLDPTLPTYADARDTYFDRLNLLATLPTKYQAVTAQNQASLFLPGPYGSMITGVTCFNLAWVALGQSFGTGSNSWAIHPELGDTLNDWVRFGQTMTLPVTKGLVSKLTSGAQGGDGTALGSVTYCILPSTWSAVADPLTYDFREDFMGASLDTATVWTRAQSSVGNVEINTDFAWCKIIGNNSSWGPNGAYSQSSFARADQPYFVADVCMPVTTTSAYGFMVGFSDGTGHEFGDFVHGVLIQTNSTIKVAEANNDRGEVGSGFSKGCIYRVRIRALSGGGASYEIQGGPEYPAIGAGTWTDITPGTTAGTTTPLMAGFAAAGNDVNYVGDIRVYTP